MEKAKANGVAKLRLFVLQAKVVEKVENLHPRLLVVVVAERHRQLEEKEAVEGN